MDNNNSSKHTLSFNHQLQQQQSASEAAGGSAIVATTRDNNRNFDSATVGAKQAKNNSSRRLRDNSNLATTSHNHHQQQQDEQHGGGGGGGAGGGSGRNGRKHGGGGGRGKGSASSQAVASIDGGSSSRQQQQQQQRRQPRLSGSSSATSGSGLEFGADAFDCYGADDGRNKHHRDYPQIGGGSRKQNTNINHMMRFTMQPRTATTARNGHADRGGRAATANAAFSLYNTQRYNKEQFVQANCHQFVVRSTAPIPMAWRCPTLLSELSVAATVDQLVDWDYVEQVHLHVTAAGDADGSWQCPICLHAPVAAKMTRCGHVYCWPCMLHYLALSDDAWRKCPICYESVYEDGLRSCVARRCVTYAIGDCVDLQLMRRGKRSLHVQPVAADGETAAAVASLPYLLDEERGTASSAGLRHGGHSKLLLAKAADIRSIVQRERRELQQLRERDGSDCPEMVFVQQALEQLRQREEALLDGGNGAALAAAGRRGKSVMKTKSLLADEMQALSLAPAVGDGGEQIGAAAAAAAAGGGCQQPAESLLEHSDEQDDYLYFYQASDTQLMYMHTVNLRMLQAQFVDLRLAPAQIVARIVHMEHCSMTEAMRKRLKFLHHLPIGSQFEVVEVELAGTGVVSDVVLDMFHGELASRQQQRQRRATEERKRDKKIDEVHGRELDKILRRNRGPGIDVMSEQHFPVYTNEYDATAFDGPPLGAPDAAAATQPVAAAPAKGRRRKSRQHDADVPGGSFAKMLSAPHQATADRWPNLSPTSPSVMAAAFSNSTAVGGTPAWDSGQAQAAAAVGGGFNEEDYVDFSDFGASPPDSGPNYGSAIAMALHQREMFDALRMQTVVGGNNNQRSVGSASGSGCATAGGGANKSNKKKKKKNDILFTTNVRSYRN